RRCRHLCPQSERHDVERAIDRPQHGVKLVATAHDETGRGDHAVGALSTRELRTFLDAVDGNFRGAAEHGKYRAVLQEIDRVITPFAGGNFATIEAENVVELAPVEGHSDWGGKGRSSGGFAPLELARLSIAVAHSAPPCDRSNATMIAPDASIGKRE